MPTASLTIDDAHVTMLPGLSGWWAVQGRLPPAVEHVTHAVFRSKDDAIAWANEHITEWSADAVVRVIEVGDPGSSDQDETGGRRLEGRVRETRVEQMERLLSESLQHWDWFDGGGPYPPLSRHAKWESWLLRARAALETPKEGD